MPEDIRTDAHAPQVVSVGLPFIVVELASRDALRRASPNRAAFDTWLPLDGATSVYGLHARHRGAGGTTCRARMFMARMAEDPATGSATVATAALLAALQPDTDAEFRLRIGQGVDMGRPSLLLTRVRKQGGAVVEAHVGGRCIGVMQGSLQVAGLA